MFGKHKAEMPEATEPERAIREVQLQQYAVFEKAAVFQIQKAMPDLIEAMKKDETANDGMAAYDAVVEGVVALLVEEAAGVGILKLDDLTREHVRKLL